MKKILFTRLTIILIVVLSINLSFTNGFTAQEQGGESLEDNNKKFIRQGQHHHLNVTLTSTTLFIVLKDFKNQKFYFKYYTKEDLGGEINRKLELQDVYTLLKCGVTDEGLIDSYKGFGSVFKLNNQPCFKIQENGKITVYFTLNNVSTKNKMVIQNVLSLKLIRPLRQLQIQRAKNSILTKKINDLKKKIADEQNSFTSLILQGHVQYQNGEKYTGDYSQGQRTGEGKYVYKNKDVYEGFWDNGVRKGRGTLVSADGSSYTGFFENDRKHGQGVEKNGDGSIYKGIWINGKRVIGTYTFKDGQSYEEQRTYKPNGQIVIKYKTQDYDFVYQGQYLNDQPHGKGKLIFEKGLVVEEVRFVNGKKQGKGIITERDGDKIQVVYKNGKELSRVYI